MSKPVIQLKLVRIYEEELNGVYGIPHITEFYHNHTLIFREYDQYHGLFLNGYRKALDMLNEPTVYVEETVVDAERFNGR